MKNISPLDADVLIRELKQITETLYLHTLEINKILSENKILTEKQEALLLNDLNHYQEARQSVIECLETTNTTIDNDDNITQVYNKIKENQKTQELTKILNDFLNITLKEGPENEDVLMHLKKEQQFVQEWLSTSTNSKEIKSDKYRAFVSIVKYPEIAPSEEYYKLITNGFEYPIPLYLFKNEFFLKKLSIPNSLINNVKLPNAIIAEDTSNASAVDQEVCDVNVLKIPWNIITGSPLKIEKRMQQEKMSLQKFLSLFGTTGLVELLMIDSTFIGVFPLEKEMEFTPENIDKTEISKILETCNKLYEDGFLYRHVTSEEVHYFPSLKGLRFIEKDSVQNQFQKCLGGNNLYLTGLPLIRNKEPNFALKRYIALFYAIQMIKEELLETSNNYLESYCNTNVDGTVIYLYMRNNSPVVLIPTDFNVDESTDVYPDIDRLFNDDKIETYIFCIAGDNRIALWDHYLEKYSKRKQTFFVDYMSINIYTSDAELTTITDVIKPLKNINDAKFLALTPKTMEPLPLKKQLPEDIEKYIPGNKLISDSEHQSITKTKNPNSFTEHRDKSLKISIPERLSEEHDLTSVLMTIEENKDLQTVLKCMEGYRFPEALVYLRALGNNNPDYMGLYECFAYALDDPLQAPHYNIKNIYNIYTKNSEAFTESIQALYICATLRMYLSSQYNVFEANNSTDYIQDNFIFEKVPQLKQIFHELSVLITVLNSTLEKGVFNRATEYELLENELKDLEIGCTNLLNGRLNETNVPMSRIKDLRENLFGPKSEIYAILKTIQQQNVSALNSVKNFAASFTKKDSTILEKEQLKVYIEKYWNALKDTQSASKHEKLNSTQMRSISKRCEDIIVLVNKWIELIEIKQGKDLNQNQSNHLEKAIHLINGYISQVHKAISLLESKDPLFNAAKSVLLFTISELKDQTNGKTYNRKYFYIDFLKGVNIELDEKYLPNMEENMPFINGYSILDRIKCHVQEKHDNDWASVLQRIFPEARPNNSAYDYGSARLLKGYLQETEDFKWPERFNIDQHIDAIAPKVEHMTIQFISQIELAANYGQIEEYKDKEDIMNHMQVWGENYQSKGNYGFYFRLLDAYKKAVSENAKLLKPLYQKQLDLARQGRESWKIFARVETLIEKNMFSVAQDYIEKATKEGLEEPPFETSLLPTPDVFLEFINQYDRFYNDSNNHALTLEHLYHGGKMKNAKSKNSQKFISSWPKGNNSNFNAVMFFEQMGFIINHVETSKKGESYYVTFQTKGTNYYRHPIAPFGSGMEKEGLNVHIIFGKKSAQSLFDQIVKSVESVTNNAAHLVLLDNSLPLVERRKYVHTLRRSNVTMVQPCIFMDRVLALYLTESELTDRWDTFLRCSMPFTNYNPYVEGAANMPPDIFMGRNTVLSEIIKCKTTLLYGGRQLGKSAVLRQVKKMVDKRKDGKWVIYTECLKNCNHKSALQELYNLLCDENFFTKPANCTSWKELKRLLTLRMKENYNNDTLLLLLDETDKFLTSCESIDYEPIDVLKQVETDTENRFKFVLAGLHNVLRFNYNAQSNNSVLGQLNAVCLGPLSYIDAAELLEKPLSYLGFRIDRNKIELISLILSTANYYPGLIHFYCSQLVRYLQQYSSSQEVPPYDLTEDEILKLLQKKEFNEQITDKFMITLKVDEEQSYLCLANALAYCYYDKPDQAVYGYSVDDIAKVCSDFDCTNITNLKELQIIALLKEMKELNILRSDSEEKNYTFSRISFRRMLGDEETLFNTLDELS